MGVFSRYLAARGSYVVGVEANSIAAEQARIVCKQVIVGDVEAAQVQAQINGRFDCVLLGDILEHLRSPESLLMQIRTSWLKRDGWVVLSTPNSGHWCFRREVLHGRFPRQQYGLFDRTHLQFFTFHSLRELVTRCGYRVEQIAHSVNPNSYELTFACLSTLYRHKRARYYMLNLESWLAGKFPRLFAYQFIIRLRAIV
jgi:2-polyprenyl-3-methyl-5-hydroxy-6-metoxy-1,4-benzoquinol methylase